MSLHSLVKSFHIGIGLVCVEGYSEIAAETGNESVVDPDTSLHLIEFLTQRSQCTGVTVDQLVSVDVDTETLFGNLLQIGKTPVAVVDNGGDTADNGVGIVLVSIDPLQGGDIDFVALITNTAVDLYQSLCKIISLCDDAGCLSRQFSHKGIQFLIILMCKSGNGQLRSDPCTAPGIKFLGTLIDHCCHFAPTGNKLAPLFKEKVGKSCSNC